MNGLSTETLRIAVSEFLIKNIGEELGIRKTFDKTKSSPRAYFLGKNPITTSLHWMFINDYYKISAFDKLPEDIRNQLKGKVNGKYEIKRDDAIELLREKSKDVIVVDPTSFLESPSEPQGYPIDEETETSILQGASINAGIRKLMPQIYTEESQPAMDIKDQIKDYHKKKRLGLSMNAFHHDKVYFSPYAILDPRSCEPGYWDVLLGIETTIYLPVGLPGKSPFGVLSISQDIGTAKFKKIKKWGHKDLTNIHDKIDIDEDSLKIISQYKYLTEKLAEPHKEVLQKEWDRIKKKPKIIYGIELLHFLFQTSVKYYNEYTFNLDDNIVRRNLETTRNGPLNKTLERLKSHEQSPVDIITEYIDSRKLPTLEYLKNLSRIEPFLQKIGKREHYIHMFNVFLLGRIFWKHLFGKCPSTFYKRWQAIALSHDITYPIEAIEAEIEEFFEIYFHNKKTPRFLISHELLYSYGEFGKFLQNLVEKASKCLNFTERQKAIFEDLVLFNLHNRRDHAIVSALFTVMSFIRKGRSEDYAYKVAIPIFLHNLYQWKFYACNEINDFKINEEFRVSSLSSEGFAYKFENSNLISFVFDRRFKAPLDRKHNLKEKIDEFKRLLEKYKRGVSSIKITVDVATSDGNHEMIKYIFILALTDFWQEWGRVTFTDKGMAAIGVRMSIPKDNDKTVKIIVPFITYKPGEYLQPVDNKLISWKSNPKEKLIISDEYFRNTSDKEIKNAIRIHTESTIIRAFEKNEKEAKKQAMQAVYKQNMLKLWEYVYKFSRFDDPEGTSKYGLRGTFEYEEDFLLIIWKGIKGIKDTIDETKDFRWPK